MELMKTRHGSDNGTVLVTSNLVCSIETARVIADSDTREVYNAGVRIFVDKDAPVDIIHISHRWPGNLGR